MREKERNLGLFFATVLILAGLRFARINPFLSIQAQGGSADLAPQKVSACVMMNRDLEVSGEATNQGNLTAGPSEAGVKVNGRSLSSTISIEAVPPGESRTFRQIFPPKGPVVGSQGGFAEVGLDVMNQVSEKDENNNTSLPVQIKACLSSDPSTPEPPGSFMIYIPFAAKNAQMP